MAPSILNVILSITSLFISLQRTIGTVDLQTLNTHNATSITFEESRPGRRRRRERRRNQAPPYLTDKERQRLKEEWERRMLYEDNEYLNDLEAWKHAWNYLHVVVTPQNPVVAPTNNNEISPGQVLADNADVNNIRGNGVGRSKQGCIRSTNFVCTWTIFLASIAKSGCDVNLQGVYIPVQPLTSFGVPVDQFVAIVGGTGPCRGITGEVKISPRTLSFPTQYDYEFYYIIRG